MTDVITTERLVLRPLRDADGDVVISALNDFAIVSWLASPPYPFSAADLRLKNQDGTSRWPDIAAIEHDGRMIGIISGRPHLGFWLLREFWGRGLATEAAKAMITFIFAKPNHDDILSGYFEGNLPSAGVLKKLGFVEIGRAQKLCVARGEVIPHVNLALQRENWEAYS